MNQADIDRMYAEIRVEKQKFDDAVAQFQAPKPAMEAELQTLKEELPRLLAGVVLGEVPKSKVQQAKRRMKEIKEFLEDFKLIEEGKGFETYEARINSKGRKVSNDERKVQRYEALKQRFIKKPNLYYEKELFSEAEVLGRLDEAKEFLADLRKSK